MAYRPTPGPTEYKTWILGNKIRTFLLPLFASKLNCHPPRSWQHGLSPKMYQIDCKISIPEKKSNQYFISIFFSFLFN